AFPAAAGPSQTSLNPAGVCATVFLSVADTVGVSIRIRSYPLHGICAREGRFDGRLPMALNIVGRGQSAPSLGQLAHSGCRPAARWSGHSDLGVVARLEREGLSAVEQVAPVVFYQTQFPAKVTGYVFHFRLREDAKVKGVIYKIAGADAVFTQD